MDYSHIKCLSPWNPLLRLSDIKGINIQEPDISFIIICKNEERCIERCIKSILVEKSDKDELLVIDTGSTDKTIAIVSRLIECGLISTSWNNDFSEIRNFGIQVATKEWIFFIDADETLLRGSTANLKASLSLLRHNQINSLIISPTIINKNHHAIRDVKRILAKQSQIRYYGVIHEEPRLGQNLCGADLIHVHIDNVVLEHDGYQQEIVLLKQKETRNISLLKIMLQEEPLNPRWQYFFCRDGISSLSHIEYEKNMVKVINLAREKPYFIRYQLRALSDLIGFYIGCNRTCEAEVCLYDLEALQPDLSDIVYYRYLIRYLAFKRDITNLAVQLVNYRKTQNAIEYGGMHSSYFHIEYLIALFMFKVEEYEFSFQILRSLKKNNFGNYETLFGQLYEHMTKFYKED